MQFISQTLNLGDGGDKKKTQERRKFSSETYFLCYFSLQSELVAKTSKKKKKSISCFALETTENTIKQEGYKVRVKIDTQKNFNRREKFGERKFY